MFENILNNLKNGQRVRRKSWNVEKLYIWFDQDKKCFNTEWEGNYHSPWIITDEGLLADDWVVL